MHEEKCCLVCRIFLDKTLQDSVKSMSSNVSPNMCRLYPQYILDMWHISFTQVQSCSQGKYTGSFSGGQVSIIAHFFIIYVCIIAHRSYYHHQTSFSRCYKDWGVLAWYSIQETILIPNFVSQWLCKLIDIAVQINRELGGRHLTEVFPFIRSDKWSLSLHKVR